MSKQNGLDTSELYQTTMKGVYNLCYWCVLGACVALLTILLSDCTYPVNPKPDVPIASTYDRPAAYRLSSPTQDQMDSMEHLRTIQRGR